MWWLVAASILASCASRRPGTDIGFLREKADQEPVIVKLRWLPNQGPPYYSPRGPMREISISEGGGTVAVPVDEITAVEDIWPDEVRLASPGPGDYELSIPYGAGEPSTGIFRFANYRYAGRVVRPTYHFPFLIRKPDHEWRWLR